MWADQAYNYAGFVVGGALAGLLGWKLGWIFVFWLAVSFTTLAIVSVLLIPGNSIEFGPAIHPP